MIIISNGRSRSRREGEGGRSLSPPQWVLYHHDTWTIRIVRLSLSIPDHPLGVPDLSEAVSAQMVRQAGGASRAQSNFLKV